MLKYVIIDKSKTDRVNLKRCLDQFSHFHLLQSSSDIKSAEKTIRTTETDLLFIELPSSLDELLSLLDTLPYEKPTLVAMASERKYAEMAFDIMAKGFILKPFTNENVGKVLTKITRAGNEDELKDRSAIFVRDGHGYVPVQLKDIYLIEAHRDSVTFHTKDRNYIINATLKKVHEQLPASDFIRIHKSCVVRRDSIREINDNHVIVEHVTREIGEAYRTELLEKLSLV